MNQTYTMKQKIRQLFIILLPILITQIALCSIGFFDTMMSGHASQNDLAGVAIGANVWLPIFTGINGILIAVTPIIAQLNGAGRNKEMPFILMQGVYLALALAVLVIIVGAVTLLPALDLMQLEPAVKNIAYGFLGAIAFGIMPLFVSTTLRNFIDTLGYTRITMVITLCALPINVMFNYLLVFGKYGFPRLGGVGAGYASAITYWVIAVILICVIHLRAPFRDYGILHTCYRISLSAWKELLKIGIPIGFAIFCETSIFGVVTILVAKFGTLTVAAHQAAINFAGLVYMFPLSMSMALTIVVGFEVGAKRLHDARQYTHVGIGFSLIVALVCAAGLWLGSEKVAALYTNDRNVLQLTEHFLLYAAFFQLSDAIAAPIQGVLRGYKDVTITFVVALISYWVIGLPIGIILSHFPAWGAFGYWVGFIAGLASGAIALAGRLIWIQTKTASC